MKLRTNKYAMKIILMVEVISLLSNSLFCAVSIARTSVSIRHSIQQRMIDIANCASGSVNGDILKKLTAEDKGTEEYQSIYNTLGGLSGQLEYVYGIRDEGGGRFTFTVDAALTDPGAFGDKVVSTKALERASQGITTVDEIPYSDAWGSFYSAYSPVFDSSGNVAGIIAYDVFSVIHNLVNSVAERARAKSLADGLQAVRAALDEFDAEQAKELLDTFIRRL